MEIRLGTISLPLAASRMVDAAMKFSFSIIAAMATLLAVAGTAHAGLHAKKTAAKSLSVAGSYPVCEPVVVQRTVNFNLPTKAVRPRIEGPLVGDSYGSRTHDPARPWAVLATVDSALSSVNSNQFVVDFAMTVSRNNDASCSPPPTGQIGYDGSIWLIEPTARVSYGMKWRDRFRATMVDYNGDREGHRVPQGGYHELSFQDKLRLKTRYTVCIQGDLESRCWHRRTNSRGVGAVDASIFINDHTTSGEVSWTVDGKRVASRRYSLIAEGF